MTNLSGTGLNNRRKVGPKGEGRDSPNNFSQYPEYKDSGIQWIGKVPSSWGLGRLKHLLRIRGGQDYKAVESFEQTEFPVIGSGGQFTYATDYLYEGESVLLGRKGTIDKPLYVNGKFWTVDTMFYTEVLPITSGRYAYYAATTIPFSLYSTSTALPSMSQFDLANHALPLPTYQEQIQIARFLDHETACIDALIEEQQRLIELLKEKRQAVISHAVTKGLDPNATMKDSGVEWLGEVPAHWKVVSLRYFVRTTKGFAFKSQDYRDEGVRMVRASDIKNKTILESSVFLPIEFASTHRSVKLSEGDIVISTVGSNPDVVNSAVGQVGMVPPKLHGTLLNQNTVMLRPTDEVDRQYFMQVLSATSYRKYLDLNAHGTANQSSLSLEEILDFKAAIPPLDEQLAIAENVLETNNLLTKLLEESEKQIGFLLERRSALISAAATGKIDVRNWQPAQSKETEVAEDYAMVAESAAEYR